ncbi:hypothetical protein VWO34_09810, partial [Campylobacter coli]|nr:hypothetical protein [Campylobacter coli]
MKNSESVRNAKKVLVFAFYQMKEGKDVKNQDVVALRKNVGMVFQQPNVFVKSIYENISYAPKLH